MSDIAPIQPAGMTPAATQTAPATGIGQAGAMSETASASSMASSMSVQESYQSMSVSMSSQVQTMLAQYGVNLGSDDMTRNLVIMALLLTLLEMLEGRKDSGQLLSGVLGGGQSATILLSESSFTASFAMESSSYQMAATQAYASSSALASQSGAGLGADVVSPTDTQTPMDAGDAGHQLNVVA